MYQISILDIVEFFTQESMDDIELVSEEQGYKPNYVCSKKSHRNSL